MQNQENYQEKNQKHAFQVNLGGMIDILSNHLYSSPDVFVRELLQNGTDAISARKLSDPGFQDGRIMIRIRERESLSFRDNGTGLTEQEIHQFLAVIGQSSKRDLQTGKIREDYIGRFGIGLLSCFMVTDEIIIRTKSVKDPAHIYEFHGKPDGMYEILELHHFNFPVGTEILIQAKKNCESYFTEEKICELVRYYGLPLPFPVMMQKPEGEFYRINSYDLKNSENSKNPDQDIMNLGRQIFDMDFLGYIPLESRSGLFSGVAYILPYSVSVHAKNTHRIYLKNMLLTENGDAILPKWSGFLKCFLNTSQLRPTASRENFYEDETLEQARQELSDCISDYLKNLSRTNPELLEDMIRIHAMAIKSLASEDELFFETFIPFLTFETNMGEYTGKNLLSRTDAVYYTPDINQFHRTSALMLAQNQLLVNACYVYDAALLRMLQDYDENFILCPLESVTFGEFLTQPPTDALYQARQLLRTAEQALAEFSCCAELKCFSPAQLPVFYMLDKDAETYREVQHAKENSSDLFASMLESFAEEYKSSDAVLYLNWNNHLIRKLADLQNQERQRICLEILYVQNLLTGRFPLQGTEMQLLNDNLMQAISWGLDLN
ncbi:MAG: HSP90 family protein [Oscillospiraceae bacterium]|nr:HSP90 family protein [Oscillospiraceae bacterium]